MKLKTKKALAKRLNLSATRIKKGGARRRHNLRRRETDVKRQTKGLSDLHCSHERFVSKLMPYARVNRIKSKSNTEERGR